MIGYILLVVFAVIISVFVFQWLRTYVPADGLQCPDGVSLFLEKAEFDSGNSEINLTIANNGRFNVAGYFVHATNSSEQEIATIDLSTILNEDPTEEKIFGNSVLFSVAGDNSFKPGDKTSHLFTIPAEMGTLTSVEIIPTRYEEIDNRKRFTSCSNAGTKQIVVILASFIVFVTSGGPYNGNRGGLNGADFECNNLAGDSGLDGTFVAWMSDSSVNAKDRLNESEEKAYSLINGKVIASSKSNLIDGNILSPINIDENGNFQTSSGGAWTGTNEFGVSTGQHCNDWTSSSGLGTRGKLDQTDKDWTNFNQDSCSDDARIYCFQVS